MILGLVLVWAGANIIWLVRATNRARAAHQSIVKSDHAALLAACRQLIEKRPELEQVVHDAINLYRGNAIGMLEYQRFVPELDHEKNQLRKVRHYKNRCRELNITPDQTLIDDILDPDLDFVIGVEAG